MSHLPLSLMNRLKPSLLFSNFGCCVSKGSLFRLLTLFFKKLGWPHHLHGCTLCVFAMTFRQSLSKVVLQRRKCFFFTKIQQTLVESVKEK